jgi:hypothetical protein
MSKPSISHASSCVAATVTDMEQAQQDAISIELFEMKTEIVFFSRPLIGGSAKSHFLPCSMRL